ncbi:MAG: hypothetical protein LBU05_05370 [Bifidobacteriaceae bacterium]|nr:hypothetical protein [Bifidobacteriaceae bacterium]
MAFLVFHACKPEPSLNSEDASTEGWEWPLNVGSGRVHCERGISGQEIGFKPNGASDYIPLSRNAWAARKAGTDDKYNARLATYWTDRSLPIKPFVEAVWAKCGEHYLSDYEIDTILS